MSEIETADRCDISLVNVTNSTLNRPLVVDVVTDPAASAPGRERFAKVDLWATDSLPVRLTEDDPTLWDLGTSMANGSVFRLCRFEPGVAERWHRTDSLDYGIILSGEILMQLDEEEVLLKAGDIVIQRGTMHNLVNRGTAPCVVAFILIATEGGASTGW